MIKFVNNTLFNYNMNIMKVNGLTFAVWLSKLWFIWLY